MITSHYKRHTAYKFWVQDIAEAVPKREDTTFFEIRGKKAVRVNILANVIHKYVNLGNSYGLLMLDDGSGQVRIKAWDEDVRLVNKAGIGNCVLVVGRLTHINNETFIRPEIVRVVDDLEWELVRKLELNKMYGQPEKQIMDPAVIEDVVNEEPIEPSIAAREKIMGLIEKNSGEEGLEIAELVELAHMEEKKAEAVIEELLKEGEAYQPRQGYIKLI